MQYTTHYNLNLPEGTDIVNPLIQDNPNYSAIDTALYDNKLRVIGNATHVKTGTNHAITLADSDIAAFKFVATGDYATGDTFTVDGVTVTARVADGATIANGGFKINSTVIAELNGTILNLINVSSSDSASDVTYSNIVSGLTATDVQSAIDEVAGLEASTANKVANVNTSDYRWYGSTFSTTASGGQYMAALPSMPVGKTASAADYYVYGVGNVVLGSVLNVTNPYIWTNDATYAGKACAIRIHFT